MAVVEYSKVASFCWPGYSKWTGQKCLELQDTQQPKNLFGYSATSVVQVTQKELEKFARFVEYSQKVDIFEDFFDSLGALELF